MDHSSEKNNANDPEIPSARGVRAPSYAWTIALVAIAAIGIGYEYRAVIFTSGLFVWVPLLLCLGMHLFMHRGHGRNHDHRGDGDE